MFYKLVIKLFIVGRFYFGFFVVYFGLYLIFPRLQCLHCALGRAKIYAQNILTNKLDLI